jgi:hypothetical protein
VYGTTDIFLEKIVDDPVREMTLFLAAPDVSTARASVREHRGGRCRMDLRITTRARRKCFGLWSR